MGRGGVEKELGILRQKGDAFWRGVGPGEGGCSSLVREEIEVDGGLESLVGCGAVFALKLGVRFGGLEVEADGVADLTGDIERGASHNDPLEGDDFFRVEGGAFDELCDFVGILDEGAGVGSNVIEGGRGSGFDEFGVDDGGGNGRAAIECFMGVLPAGGSLIPG